MPLTEPAVRFSRNGLFNITHINSHIKYKDCDKSPVLEADAFAGTV